MEKWILSQQLFRMFPCCSRIRFWPLLVSLVFAIIMLQVLHIALLSRLEAKEAQLRQGPIIGGRQLQGRMFNNVISEMEDRVKSSFRLDKSGTYHLLDNFLTSEHVVLGKNSHDVSVVTQCSSDNLHYLVDLSEKWNGPISVSVFTFDEDFIHAVTKLLQLHFCHNHIFRHVSFHLVFPISRAPKHFVDMSKIKLDCSVGSLDNILTPKADAPIVSSLNYNRKDIEYPVNLLRNLAINYVQTSYVFMIDIDLVPSSNLRHSFRNFMSSRVGSSTSDVLDNLDAFVIPVFEIQSSQSSHIPGNKSELLKAWSNGIVRPFYWEPCEKCHRPTDYQTWRLLGSKGGSLGVGYTVNRVDPWEPFYIAKTSTLPLYDERFKQYGFNRISQICEMHMAGYKFHVLDNAFLVHRGFKIKDKFHAKKDAENDRSRVLFRTFKEEFKVRYPDVDRRC